MSIFRIEKLAELNEDVFKDVLFFKLPNGVRWVNLVVFA